MSVKLAKISVPKTSERFRFCRVRRQVTPKRRCANGRDGEIRTRDLLLPKQALYQAKLRPDSGPGYAEERARDPKDLCVANQNFRVICPGKPIYPALLNCRAGDRAVPYSRAGVPQAAALQSIRVNLPSSLSVPIYRVRVVPSIGCSSGGVAAGASRLTAAAVKRPRRGRRGSRKVKSWSAGDLARDGVGLSASGCLSGGSFLQQSFPTSTSMIVAQGGAVDPDGGNGGG